jgi:outer membrane lipoprotein-sorting protein
MDGEHLSRHVGHALEQHLQTCAACRAFEAGAYKLREHARIGLAPAVPDLVEPIMAAIEAEARPAPRRVRPLRAPAPRRPLLPRLAPAVAAAVVGLLVGSLAVGGPWSHEHRATAVDVTEGVAAAAARLDAYRATFSIVERNLAPDVPRRDLSMEVWFRAPERFRLDVTDHTIYPSDAYSPTDLRLVVDGSTWYARAPSPCPTTGCPPTETLVTNRTPLSSTATAPTDLVLPVTTLSDDEGVTVLGTGMVLGRPALRVEMRFERAAPLFPFLQLGGTWRPFFPDDRVVLWLDAKTWSPLEWSVYPAGGPERAQWELRFGLPEEPKVTPILKVEAVAVSEKAPPAAVFAVPTTVSAVDQGATTVPLDAVEREAGYEPVTPAEVDGLSLYQVALPSDPAGKAGDTVLAYSRGMQWLKVGESRSWEGDSLLGPVGPHAQEVALEGGGVAYYEPATEDHGRRLAIHTSDSDLYLETNLSRDALLRVASSLPLKGLTLPQDWRVRETPEGTIERVSLEDAEAAVPFELLLPQTLPEGTTLAAVELLQLGDAVGVTAYFQAEDVALGSGEIRVHLEQADDLPPSTASDQQSVQVRGVEGRFTLEAARLEWIEGGLYVSVEAPGLELTDLLAIASSLAPVPASPGPTP